MEIKRHHYHQPRYSIPPAPFLLEYAVLLSSAYIRETQILWPT